MSFRISVCCASIAIVAFCGCAKTEGPAGRAAAGGKRYGGTYRMNMIRGNPNGLDPVIINSKLADDIASQIYDQLISLDSNLALVPELATRWEMLDGGKRYVFQLRTDVRFHDDPCFAGGQGRALTARDVKYSFERACDPRTRTVAYWVFQDKVEGANDYFNARTGDAAPTVAEVRGFVARDDSTFEIDLVKPYAPFIYYLVESCCDVVPREAVERYGKDFFQHPVGSGAFVFDHWTPDQEIVVRRNPHYWQRDPAGNALPLLDGATFTFVKDDKIQLSEFARGTFDECFPLPTEFFDDIVDVASGTPKGQYAKSVLQRTPALCSWFFNFLTTTGTFRDARIRRAFSFAVDREKIVRFVLKGQPFAPGMHGIVPPAFHGYPVDSVRGYGYDPERAKALLAEAGYPGGRGFPEVTLNLYPDPRLLQIGEAIQNMLTTTLGIPVRIQQTQFAQMLDAAEAGKLEFWGTRWYGDYPDPENFLNLWYGALVPPTDKVPSYPNDTRYNGREFNALFERALAIADEHARDSLYAAAETAAMADAPSIIIFYEQHYRLLVPAVHGNPLDPMARVDLKWVWKD